MAVDAAQDGLEAVAKLNVSAYDVVVLDRDPPVITTTPGVGYRISAPPSRVQ